MKDQQKFPPVYKAIAFSVYEQACLVRVCLRANAPLPLLADCLYSYAGTAHVSLSHQEYLDALYEDPGLVLAIRGVSFTPYLMSALHYQHGMLVMERSCQWKGVHWPPPFSSDFQLTLLTATHLLTWAARTLLLDTDSHDIPRAAATREQSERGFPAHI